MIYKWENDPHRSVAMKEIVHIDFFGCISSAGQNKIDFKYLSAHSFVGTKNFVKFVLHLTCGFNDPLIKEEFVQIL